MAPLETVHRDIIRLPAGALQFLHENSSHSALFLAFCLRGRFCTIVSFGSWARIVNGRDNWRAFICDTQLETYIKFICSAIHDMISMDSVIRGTFYRLVLAEQSSDLCQIT